MNSDITIVGAGPAGLSFALLLADSGLRITLVDRHSSDQLARPAVLRLANNLPPIKRAIRHLLTEPRARIRLLPSLRT